MLLSFLIICKPNKVVKFHSRNTDFKYLKRGHVYIANAEKEDVMYVLCLFFAASTNQVNKASSLNSKHTLYGVGMKSYPVNLLFIDFSRWAIKSAGCFSALAVVRVSVAN